MKRFLILAFAVLFIATGFSQTTIGPFITTQGWFKGVPEFNVKAYGAKGDWNGTTGTDDTAAFNSAMAAVCAKGGTFHMPAGSYKITGEVQVPQGCTGSVIVTGDGAPNTNSRTDAVLGTRIVQTSTTADAFHAYPMNSIASPFYSTDLTFRNFTVVGAKDFSGTTGSCLHIGNGNGRTTDFIFFVHLENLNLEKCSLHDLWVDGSTNATASPFKLRVDRVLTSYAGSDGRKVSGWVEQYYDFDGWNGPNGVNQVEVSNCGGTCNQTDFRFVRMAMVPGVTSGGPVGFKLDGTTNVTIEDTYFEPGHSKMGSITGTTNNLVVTGNSKMNQGASDQGFVMETGASCANCSFGNKGWLNLGTNPMVKWSAGTTPSNVTYGEKSPNGGAAPYMTLADIGTASLPSSNTYTYLQHFAARNLMTTTTKNVDEIVNPTAGATDLISQINTCMAGAGANTISYCIIPPGYGVNAISSITRDGSNNATATIPTGHGLIVGDKIDVEMWTPATFGCYGCTITGATATTVTWTSTGSALGATGPIQGEIVKSVANASVAGWQTNKILIDKRSWGDKVFSRDNGGTTTPWFVYIDPATLKSTLNLGNLSVQSSVTNYVAQIKNLTSGAGNNGLKVSTTDTSSSTIPFAVDANGTNLFRTIADGRSLFGTNLIIAANGQIQSSLATGSAPMTTASTTPVTNFSLGGGTGTTVKTEAYSTNTVCTSSGGTCSAAAAGRVSIAAAATTVTVATTRVTSSSQIFIQEDSSLGAALGVTCNTTTGRLYTVTARTAGTSFVITTSAAPTTNPACLSFGILN